MRIKRTLQFLIGFYLERPLALFGLFLVLIYVFLLFFGDRIAPYDPEAASRDFLMAPSSKHWLGTDSTGLDIFSRIISAPKVDLTIGLIATGLAAVIGIPFGVISGYLRGWGGSAVSRTFDMVQCLPTFVIAMSLVAFAGQNMINIIIVLALLNAPIYVRLVRSKVNSVRQRKFVESAICLGNPIWRIMQYHLLPNSLEPILIQFPVNVGLAILTTAGLSFVGAGIRTPTPEWGAMISEGAPLIATGQWWVAIFPGIAIGLCVLGLALFASSLEILLDPTRR